jgi:ferric-dicitrate binding protein FerR (iron transport regulator)
MTSAACRRAWEAEAARDGRLPNAARVAHEAHARQCAHCSRERAQLEQLATSLRQVPAHPHDQLVLPRARRHLLQSVNRQLLGAAPSGKRRARLAWALALTSLAALAAFGWLARPRSLPLASPATAAPGAAWAETSGLRLVASSGARFDRQRRPGLDVVALHEGTLSIDFARGPHADLSVRVPDGEIRDLGTVFRVVVAESHTVEIAVQEGAVVFRRPGEADTILLAGETFQRAAGSSSALDASGQAVRGSTPRAKRAPRRPLLPLAVRAPISPHAAPAATSPEDAAYLRMLGYLQAGRVQDARVAARAYLQAFPNGFRRSEVERVAREN